MNVVLVTNNSPNLVSLFVLMFGIEVELRVSGKNSSS